MKLVALPLDLSYQIIFLQLQIMGNNLCINGMGDDQDLHDAVNTIIDLKPKQPVSDIPNQQPVEVKSQKPLQNRVQIKSLPTTNTRVQENIKKLTKIGGCNNKIWKVKQPANIIYMNKDPIKQDELPQGYTQIYKIKQNGDFNGYFQGNVDSTLSTQQPDSVCVYSNASYFLGTGKKQGIFNNQLTNLKYEGGWENQMPHGVGVENSAKGKYQGSYRFGEKDGYGKFNWAEGISYQGNFSKGLFHGNGSLKDPQLNYSYDGQYMFGQKHGKGIQKNGKQIYQGEFHKGKRFGNGKLTIFANNDKENTNYVYQGNFHEGLPHGKGQYSTGKINKVAGIWQAGELKVLL